MEEKRKKVTCPECRKKTPHTHKGCNEPNAFTRVYGWDRK